MFQAIATALAGIAIVIAFLAFSAIIGGLFYGLIFYLVWTALTAASVITAEPSFLACFAVGAGIAIVFGGGVRTKKS